jgi:hypothetical protein
LVLVCVRALEARTADGQVWHVEAHSTTSRSERREESPAERDDLLDPKVHPLAARVAGDGPRAAVALLAADDLDAQGDAERESGVGAHAVGWVDQDVGFGGRDVDAEGGGGARMAHRFSGAGELGRVVRKVGVGE